MHTAPSVSTPQDLHQAYEEVRRQYVDLFYGDAIQSLCSRAIARTFFSKELDKLAAKLAGDCAATLCSLRSDSSAFGVRAEAHVRGIQMLNFVLMGDWVQAAEVARALRYSAFAGAWRSHAETVLRNHYLWRWLIINRSHIKQIIDLAIPDPPER